MLTNTKEKQVRWILTNPDVKVTISGLSVESGTAYPQTYNNVQDLVQQRIFVTENVGSGKIVTINPEAPIDVLIAIEAKRKEEFLKKHVWVELMIKDILSYTNYYFFILVIFGSYAKETYNSRSDLDLLFILPSTKNVSQFENALQKIYAKVKIDHVIVTPDYFLQMIKNPNELNVGNEAKRHHILLYGAEQWYNLIRKVR